MDGWIIYEQDEQPYEVFDQWLNKNLPSDHYQSEGTCWIYVKRKKLLPVERPDMEVMLREVEKLNNTSIDKVNVDTFFNIAKSCKKTSGKWLFYVDEGARADNLWRLVANGIVRGLLPSTDAKISATNDDDEDDPERHVVCVFNDDFCNQEQVFSLEKALRNIGVKCPLMYKPDIFTSLGIYVGNPFGLKPTIYRSQYDVISRESKIYSTLTK